MPNNSHQEALAAHFVGLEAGGCGKALMSWSMSHPGRLSRMVDPQFIEFIG